MQLFDRFLTTITDHLPLPKPSSEQVRLLAKLNPDKFYVENVRAILGVSTRSATQICEIAVNQDLFERRVEVLCPDGSVAASATTEDKLPSAVECEQEVNGFHDSQLLETRTLRKVTYYRLADPARHS